MKKHGYQIIKKLLNGIYYCIITTTNSNKNAKVLVLVGNDILYNPPGYTASQITADRIAVITCFRAKLKSCANIRLSFVRYIQLSPSVFSTLAHRSPYVVLVVSYSRGSI